MTSAERFASCLPAHLTDLMIVRGGSSSWPIEAISEVIEACREAGLTSLGGDLQVHLDAGVWESPNIGVRVFPHEIAEAEPGGRSAAAGVFAASKFAKLSARDIEKEVRAGLGLPLEASLPQARFSWAVTTEESDRAT